MSFFVHIKLFLFDYYPLSSLCRAFVLDNSFFNHPPKIITNTVLRSV
nr:MAG TPA: hypothetical protein [Caudoviricetes sp.]